jgi:hypothetical protein
MGFTLHMQSRSDRKRGKRAKRAGHVGVCVRER